MPIHNGVQSKKRRPQDQWPKQTRKADERTLQGNRFLLASPWKSREQQNDTRDSAREHRPGQPANTRLGKRRDNRHGQRRPHQSRDRGKQKPLPGVVQAKEKAGHRVQRNEPAQNGKELDSQFELRFRQVAEQKQSQWPRGQKRDERERRRSAQENPT